MATSAPHGPESDATGHKGFYCHFLDMKSGRRAWRSELSSVDSAFLLAGMLSAAAYFQQQSAVEDEIRRLADALYRKADWRWMQNGEAAVSHGWTPDKGFLRYRWQGYDEALICGGRDLPGVGWNHGRTRALIREVMHVLRPPAGRIGFARMKTE